MKRRKPVDLFELAVAAVFALKLGLVATDNADVTVHVAAGLLALALGVVAAGLIWRRAGSLITADGSSAAAWLPRFDILSLLRGRGVPGTSTGGRRDSDRVLGVGAQSRRTVRLSVADSRQHLHVLGPTGTGKSTLLLHLAAQDIAAGRGCAVLDPKGDLVRELLERIPPARLSDVVYIGLDDPEWSVGLNPLELGSGDDPALVAENTLSIFKRIYRDHWGPRTDDILKASLLTLLRTAEPTLAHIPRLLDDARFRRPIVAAAGDPLGLGSFWRWYDGLTDGQRAEATGPLLNKLREVLLRPRLRHLLCQPRSTVALREVIDSGKILLADLGTGRWGESASALAGSCIVALLWQATLARQAVPERERRDFILYLDEFQTFLGIRGPFADALAQARGLHLSLTVANQHLGQLSRELAEAVRANARSRVVFACARADAAALAPDLAPLSAEAISALPRFHAAARLVVRGGTAPVQLVRLNRPAPPRGSFAPLDNVRGAARHYAAPVRMVDAYLATLVGVAPTPDRDGSDGSAAPAGTEARS